MRLVLMCIAFIGYFQTAFCFQFTGKVISVTDNKPVVGAILRFSDYVNDTPDCSKALFYDSAKSDDSGKYTIDWPPTKNSLNYSDYRDFQVTHPDYGSLCVCSRYCEPSRIYLVRHEDSADVFYVGNVETNYGIMVEGFAMKLMTTDSTVLDSTTSGKDGSFILRFKPKPMNTLLVVSTKPGYLTQIEIVPAIPQARVWAFPVMATPENTPPPKPDHPATFTGIVKDLVSGLPISGVKVQFMSGKMPGIEFYDSTKTTGIDGRFQFSEITPMTQQGFGYLFRCEKEGYRVNSMSLINLEPDKTKDTVESLEKIYSVRIKALSDAKMQDPLDSFGVVLFSRTMHKPVAYKSSAQSVCDFYDVGIDSFDVSVCKNPFFPVVTTLKTGNSDTTPLTAVFSSSSQALKKHTVIIDFSDSNRTPDRIKSVKPLFMCPYESKTLCMLGNLSDNLHYKISLIPDTTSLGKILMIGCQNDSLMVRVKASSDTVDLLCNCNFMTNLVMDGIIVKQPEKSSNKNSALYNSKIVRYDIYDIAGRKQPLSGFGHFDLHAPIKLQRGVFMFVGFNAQGTPIEKRKIIGALR